MSSEIATAREPAGPGRRARYVMIGGFLGAGKTTAISKLGERLKNRGLRVGVITNGHGKELVDTAALRARGFSTEQVHGGCFCAQFDRLTAAAQRLSASVQPDILLAEPLGSCTDLIASLSVPLEHRYGQEFVIAPFSVMVDPVRAARVFGLENGPRFSDKISYIYRKQLEEAEVIVINKCDSVAGPKLARLKQTLEQHAVEATVFTVSAKTGAGLEEWIECVMRQRGSERIPLEIDYNVYAEAEALLSWLHCMVRLSSVKYFHSSQVLGDLAACIQSLLQQEGGEIAHLKMTLNPDEELGAIAVINLVRNDGVPEFAEELPEPIQSGEMLLNLRAEADPELLHSVVNRALLALMEKSPNLFARMENCEHFRPSRPMATHRFAPVA